MDDVECGASLLFARALRESADPNRLPECGHGNAMQGDVAAVRRATGDHVYFVARIRQPARNLPDGVLDAPAARFETFDHQGNAHATDERQRWAGFRRPASHRIPRAATENPVAWDAGLPWKETQPEIGQKRPVQSPGTVLEASRPGVNVSAPTDAGAALCITRNEGSRKRACHKAPCLRRVCIWRVCRVVCGSPPDRGKPQRRPLAGTDGLSRSRRSWSLPGSRRPGIFTNAPLAMRRFLRRLSSK